MSAAAEGAIKTLLETLAPFVGKAGSVTRSDFRVLDNGSFTQIAVIEPGTFAIESVTGLLQDFTEVIPVNIFQRYNAIDNDTITGQTFTALMDTVKTGLEASPVLQSSPLMCIAAIRATDDPQDVFDKLGAGPFFVTQKIRVEVEMRSV